MGHGLLQQVEAFVDQLLFRRQRHEEAEHVGIHAAAQKNEPVLAGLRGDGLGELGIRRAVRLHDVAGDHGTQATDIADAIAEAVLLLHVSKTRDHLLADGVGAVDQLFLFHDVEDGVGRGAADGRAAIGAT